MGIPSEIRKTINPLRPVSNHDRLGCIYLRPSPPPYRGGGTQVHDGNKHNSLKFQHISRIISLKKLPVLRRKFRTNKFTVIAGQKGANSLLFGIIVVLMLQ